MSKRRHPARIEPINLPRRLREGLTEAEELLENNRQVEAKKLLHKLAEDFPNQEDVLGLLANACAYTKDAPGCLYALRKLHALRPNNPEFSLSLAGAYLSNGCPVLAQQAFERFIHRWPGHPKYMGTNQPGKP